MSSLIAAIIIIIVIIIIIIIIIIILREAYGPFHKAKHRNETAMSILWILKNNNYLVSRILDNSLKVWISISQRVENIFTLLADNKKFSKSILHCNKGCWQA